MAEIKIVLLSNIGGGKSTLLNSVETKKTGLDLLPLLSMPGELNVRRESPRSLHIVDKFFYPTLYLQQDNVTFQTGNQKFPTIQTTKSDLLFMSEVAILRSTVQEEREDMRQGGIIFRERCVYDMRYVFVKNLVKGGLLSPEQFDDYCTIFDSLVKSLTPPDLFIYLSTSPTTAFNRRMAELKKGGGLASEQGLTEAYVTEIHGLYERLVDVILPSIIPDFKDRCLIIDANKDFSSEELEKFHLYIEQRAKKILLQRGINGSAGRAKEEPEPGPE
ncbi:Deoxynucleoside kinase [uncultured archaeon]|nr:Deoxynucleoside kinase [uncultured archaeon]